MLDRFEILKYALLFEEFIKKIIIKNIESSNINNNLNNKKIDQWKKSTAEKLKKYGKKILNQKK